MLPNESFEVGPAPLTGLTRDLSRADQLREPAVQMGLLEAELGHDLRVLEPLGPLLLTPRVNRLFLRHEAVEFLNGVLADPTLDHGFQNRQRGKSTLH